MSGRDIWLDWTWRRSVSEGLQDGRHKLQVVGLYHHDHSAIIAALGVHFVELEERILSAGKHDSSAVRTRDPGGALNHQKQLAEAGRVFPDLTTGITVQAVDMARSAPMSEVGSGNAMCSDLDELAASDCEGAEGSSRS